MDLACDSIGGSYGLDIFIRDRRGNFIGGKATHGFGVITPDRGDRMTIRERTLFARRVCMKVCFEGDSLRGINGINDGNPYL